MAFHNIEYRFNLPIAQTPTTEFSMFMCTYDIIFNNFLKLLSNMLTQSTVLSKLHNIDPNGPLLPTEIV